MRKLDEALEILDKVDDLDKQEELMNLKKQILLKKEEIEFCNKSKYLHYLDFKSFSNFQKFFEWLDIGQVCYHKLELKYFSDDHRGVLAKSKIKVKKI